MTLFLCNAEAWIKKQVNPDYIYKILRTFQHRLFPAYTLPSTELHYIVNVLSHWTYITILAVHKEPLTMTVNPED